MFMITYVCVTRYLLTEVLVKTNDKIRKRPSKKPKRIQVWGGSETGVLVEGKLAEKRSTSNETSGLASSGLTFSESVMSFKSSIETERNTKLNVRKHNAW